MRPSCPVCRCWMRQGVFGQTWRCQPCWLFDLDSLDVRDDADGHDPWFTGAYRKGPGNATCNSTENTAATSTWLPVGPGRAYALGYHQAWDDDERFRQWLGYREKEEQRAVIGNYILRHYDL